MARIIEFFDGADSTLTPVIGNIEAADLVDYPDDATYEATNAGTPFAGNIYFNTTDNTVRYYDGTAWIEVGRAVDIQANASDIADIRTTTGTADGDTDMGTYTGALINDNESAKQNIQQLETQVEQNDSDIATNASDISDNTDESADIRTTQGTANGATDMGAFSGSTISDNTSVKAALQELETALESLSSGLEFQGNWDADTNTPTLTSSTGTQGHYYYVSVAGTTDLDGITDWGVGDWAVFATGAWRKIDNSEVPNPDNGDGSYLGVYPAADPDNAGLAVDDSTAARRVVGGYKDLSGTLSYLTLDTLLIYNPIIGRSVLLATPETINSTRTGTVAVSSGAVLVAGNADSGQTRFETGVVTTGTGRTGDVTVGSGENFSSGLTGQTVIKTGDVVGGTSGDVTVESGASSTTGDSGDVTVATGVASLGTRGSIKLQDGSQGTVGHVWTSKGTGGEGNWEAASGGGQGGINYVVNSQFEDGIADVNTNATSGSVAISQDDTIIPPIRDDFHLRTVFSSANNGSYVELDMNPVDNADLGKSLYVSFDYATSIVVTGSLEVVLRDLTNNVDIQVIGGSINPTSEDIKLFTGVCYLPNAGNDYSLRVQVNGGTSSLNFYMDNAIVGPDKIIDSPILEDRKPVTVTSSWTNTTVSTMRSRVGDMARYEITATCTGTPSGGVFELTLDETVDTSKITLTNDRPYLGTAYLFDAGTTGNRELGQAFYSNGSGAIRILARAGSTVTNTTPFTFVSGDVISLSFEVPILEWANSSAVLSDKEMLNVSSNARRTADTSTAQLLPAGFGCIVDFQLEDYVNGDIKWQQGVGYNSSNGSWATDPGFVVGSSGVYDIESNVTVSALNGTNRIHNTTILVNGQGKASGNYNSNSTSTSQVTKQNKTRLQLQKGDVVTIAIFHNSTSTETVRSSSGNVYSWFSIAKRPDFSVYSVYPTPLKTQTKFLTADVNNVTASVMSDLTFTGLKIGQSYMVNGQVSIRINDAASGFVQVYNGATLLNKTEYNASSSSGPGVSGVGMASVTFIATSDTVTVQATVSGVNRIIQGNSTKNETWVSLTEISPLQETNEW